MSGRRAERRRVRASTPASSSGWARALPIIAAFAVGAASFTLSFFAQAEVSVALGAVPVSLAWLVPIVIDGGILAGSASVWAASTRGAPKDPVAYLTIYGLLALSVVINVRHASEGGGILGPVIAGAPPVVLLLCLELVAAQARRAAQANNVLADFEPDLVPVAPVSAAPVPAASPHASLTQTPGPAAPMQETAPLARPTAQPAHAGPLDASPRRSVAPTPAPTAPAPVAPTQPLPVTPWAAAPAPAPAAAHEVTDAPAGGLTPEPTAPAGTPLPTPAPARAPKAAASRTPVKSSAPKAASQSDMIRAKFAEHLGAGGDLWDSTLARHVADTLAIPLPSVRKVLAQERRLAEAAAP